LKKIIILLILALLLSLGCSTLENNPVAIEKQTGIVKLTEEDKAILENDISLPKAITDRDPTRIGNQIRLKYFAMALAASLDNEKICTIIKENVSKQFDGDTEVLWSMIHKKNISGKQNFNSILDSKFNRSTKSLLNIANIAKVPFLNIAVPINLDKWDGKTPLKVAYVPITEEDTETKIITAYDAELNEYKLDANTEPDSPVIIVGLNERMDANGKTAKPNKTNAEYVKLLNCDLRNDHEPWYKGGPEIYFLYVDALTRLVSRKNMYNYWNSSGSNHGWKNINKTLFEWHENSYSDVWSYDWLEKDTGGPKGYTIKAFGISVTIQDGDDKLGGQLVHKNDTLGRSKSNPYRSTDCHFVLQF